MANTITVTQSITSSTNSFAATLWYDDGVRFGSLAKSGASTVISGSYTAAYTKTLTDSKGMTMMEYCKWAAPNMNYTYSTVNQPDTYIVNDAGFSITMSKSTRTLLGYAYTRYATPNMNYNRNTDIYPDTAWGGTSGLVNGATYLTDYAYFTQYYTGSRVVAAVDTRVYSQTYSGNLTSYDAPPVPSVTNLTSTSVVLTSAAGTNIICNGVDKPSGATWSIVSGTNYNANAYYPADATHYKGPLSPSAGFTAPLSSRPAPLAPYATIIDAYSTVLTSSPGASIYCNGETKASGSTWKGLTPGTTYGPFAWFPPDATHSISAFAYGSFTMPKADQTPPADPTATLITDTSVRLDSSPGSMIYCNGQSKLSGSTWTSLSPATWYSSYAYFNETATYNFVTSLNFPLFKTLKSDQLAPISPSVTITGPQSALITSSTGSYVDCNGQIMASGSTWNGLMAGTTYSANAFMPSNSTHNESPRSPNTSFTMPKLNQAAPSPPTAYSIGVNSAYLSSPGALIVSNGQTYSSNSQWTGLSAATMYSAYSYYPADATHNASPNSATMNYTTLSLAKLNRSAPPTPVAMNITSDGVMLTSSGGSVIVLSNGDTRPSGYTWSGLNAATTYTAYAYIPADATYNQSPNSGTCSFTTLLSSQFPPMAPIYTSLTANSVVLTSAGGSMIYCNGSTKPSGSTWSGLSPVTAYTAYAYMPSDSTHSASPNSANANFTTIKLDQSAPAAPIVYSITDTSVVLTSTTAGAMISLNGLDKVSGSTWTGLSPATGYSAYAYMPSNYMYNRSPNSGNVNFATISTPKLDRSAPTAPIAANITSNGVMLTSSAGSVIVLSNGDAEPSGSTWSGLSVGTSYTAYAYIPGDSTYYQSPNSGTCSFTTLLYSQLAPTVPIYTGLTDTTVVLTSTAGSAIYCNGLTKPSGSTWTGLSPVTPYTAYAYMPSDATHYGSSDSANANFTTLKMGRAAPDIPVASNITINGATLTSTPGSVITLSNGVTQPSGSLWTGLSVATDYAAYAYIPGDATYDQSPNSANGTFTTLKSAQLAPDIPVASNITATSVVLTSAGARITSNGETKPSGSTWTSLSPVTSYTAYAYLEADSTHSQSPNSADANYTTVKLDQAAPVIPLATSKTGATVVLTSTAGSQIISNGVTQASGSTWVGLTSGTPYTAYAWIPGDTTHNQSPNSPICNYTSTIVTDTMMPTNPITITSTIDGPVASPVLTSAGYSGYYPGKVVQLGAKTTGFVSTLSAIDDGGSSASFTTQVNPTAYWQNTWPANGLTQNFTISPWSDWDTEYTVTASAGTPFIDKNTGLFQQGVATKTIKLDPVLVVSAASAVAVASVNQTDGMIHPSYGTYVSNKVTLNAETTGFASGAVVTVYNPSMVAVGTVTLSAGTGVDENKTTWTGEWTVPDSLEIGQYTFGFSATAYDGQPNAGMNISLDAVRDIGITSVSDTIPVATAWQYPSAQPANQAYPGQVINLFADTVGKAQSVSVLGSDGTSGADMVTPDKTLYASTWNSTFAIPVSSKIGQVYTLTYTVTDDYGNQVDKSLTLTISNPMGIVPASVSAVPDDVYQGLNPAPTVKLKITMQLYGWVTTAKINWPSPNNAQVTLVKTAGPDSKGVTSWSTNTSGIVVPRDVACGYPNSPVAPTSLPIGLNLTVNGSSDFTNLDNSVNSFTDSTVNVPISDNVKIKSFSISDSNANIGDTVLITVITTGFAEAVSVKFPWDTNPIALSNSLGSPYPYQSIWTASYKIPSTAPVDVGTPGIVTATATNTFNVKPPAGSSELDTATMPLTISNLTLHMVGPTTVARGTTLSVWGSTTGKARSVKLISVSPSIPYSGSGTLVNNLDLYSLSDPATSDSNTWYSDQEHSNGWVVPSDISADTILTFTYEATDALGIKVRDTIQVGIKSALVVVTH